MPLSQFLVGAALPAVAALDGVRWAFALLTVLTVLAAVPALTFRDPPRTRAPRRRPGGPLAPGVAPVLALSFCTGVVTQGTNAYRPLFGHTGHGG